MSTSRRPRIGAWSTGPGVKSGASRGRRRRSGTGRSGSKTNESIPSSGPGASGDRPPSARRYQFTGRAPGRGQSSSSRQRLTPCTNSRTRGPSAAVVRPPSFDRNHSMSVAEIPRPRSIDAARSRVGRSRAAPTTFGEVPVRPRADRAAASRSRASGVAAGGAHPGEVLEVVAEDHVVPTGGEEHRHAHARGATLVADTAVPRLRERGGGARCRKNVERRALGRVGGADHVLEDRRRPRVSGVMFNSSRGIVHAAPRARRARRASSSGLRLYLRTCDSAIAVSVQFRVRPHFRTPSRVSICQPST